MWRKSLGGDSLYKIPCFYEGCEEYCPYRKSEDSCQMTIHHLWWPKRLFKKRLRRQFRELPQHKIRVCRGLHDVFHLINLVPRIPTVGRMKEVVDVADREKAQRDQEYRQRMKNASQSRPKQSERKKQKNGKDNKRNL